MPPDEIFAASMRSFTSLVWILRLRLIASTAFADLSDSGPSASTSSHIVQALSGERSSCVIVAKNTSLTWFALSASLRACEASARSWSRAIDASCSAVTSSSTPTRCSASSLPGTTLIDSRPENTVPSRRLFGTVTVTLVPEESAAASCCAAGSSGVALTRKSQRLPSASFCGVARELSERFVDVDDRPARLAAVGDEHALLGGRERAVAELELVLHAPQRHRRETRSRGRSRSSCRRPRSRSRRARRRTSGRSGRPARRPGAGSAPRPGTASERACRRACGRSRCSAVRIADAA